MMRFRLITVEKGRFCKSFGLGLIGLRMGLGVCCSMLMARRIRNCITNCAGFQIKAICWDLLGVPLAALSGILEEFPCKCKGVRSRIKSFILWPLDGQRGP